jgi:mutual gliding-motility protein MglA
MADYDRDRGELHLKVIYAGPPGSGKSRSLEALFRAAAKHGRTTEVDCDAKVELVEHVQMRLGRVFGRHNAVAHVVVLPAGETLDATSRLLMRSADGVVFVADATPARHEDNARALEDLDEAMRREGRDLWSMPLVFQWNKRDLGEASGSDRGALSRGRPCYDSQATRGDGVVTAFQRVCLPALRNAGETHGIAPGSRRVVAAGKVMGTPACDAPAREAPQALRAETLDRHQAPTRVDATPSQGVVRPPVITRLLDRARAMFR